MNLKSRLALLREQSGVISGRQLQEQKADLRVRLERMQTGARERMTTRKQLSEDDLAGQLDGEVIAESLVLVEERFQLNHKHGLQSLESLVRHECTLPGIDTPEPHKLLFMDTETTGLSGGSGTLVFMLGLARMEDTELVLRQYLLTAFAGEKMMFEHCAQWLSGDETLVTFNGKSIDVPLLATRSRMVRVEDLFGRLDHIDLLHPVRRAFRSQWPECRLGTAENKLLGFERVDDLSGAEAPGAWFDWIRYGNPIRLAGVLKHNRWDIISLAALLPLLSRVYGSPGEWNADAFSITQAWIRSGDELTALRLLEASKERLSIRGWKGLA
ncbi:ribonuclease H-like domain-containing protein [Solemya velesiana gill symbiont]|uniref:YprB ribonuclease H-like domain-containing protein n=1 Tax=Solemya velesiana gill symbiont TaxID=1918948 RepID=A0A1T2KV42_9GAMM|nr:ribonuclease H-like domain-containing protein [Solemya velesiana gill symbiont]OOZ36717.1 hypothetical protein BOW51_05790 [Solemya velesiana gill symbiont]